MEYETELPPGFKTWEALYNFIQLEGLVRPGNHQVELRVNPDQSTGLPIPSMDPVTLVSFHYSIQFVKDQAYAELKLQQLRQTFTLVELHNLTHLVRAGLEAYSRSSGDMTGIDTLCHKVELLYREARMNRKR